MKEIRQLKEKGKPDGMKDKTDGLVAAQKIQKVWRGFATRRKTRRGKLEEMYLIGMVPRPIQRNAAAIEDAAKVGIKIILQHVLYFMIKFKIFRELCCAINCKLISKKPMSKR